MRLVIYSTHYSLQYIMIIGIDYTHGVKHAHFPSVCVFYGTLVWTVFIQFRFSINGNRIAKTDSRPREQYFHHPVDILAVRRDNMTGTGCGQLWFSVKVRPPRQW